MGEEQAEVRIRLVVDDQATKTAEKLKEGMKGAGEETAGAEKEASALEATMEGAELVFGAVAAAAAALAAGVAAAAAAAGLLADKAAEAASEGAEQQRSMAGLLAMMDGGVHAFSDISEYAGRVREDLEAAGIASGTSAKQMSEAFDTVIRQGGLSSEKAKDLTENMAIVGKQTGLGIDSLAAGFSGMERGMVSARNPLVQLIAATHVLHGNARAVAMQLEHMQPSRQMQIGADAIKKQAEMFKASGAVMTAQDLSQSFAGIREQFLQTMGQPILNHLLPPLRQFASFLQTHSEAIHMFAERVGEAFGTFIDQAAGFVQKVYGAFQENWPAIKQSLTEAAAPLKDAWKFVLDHKDELARAIGTAARFAAGVIAAQVRIFEATGAMLRRLIEAAAMLIPGGGSIVNSMEKGMNQDTAASSAQDLQKMAADPNVTAKDFAAKEKQFQDASAALGNDVSVATKAFEDARHRTMITAGQLDQAAGKWAGDSNADAFTGIYNQAGQAHDEAMEQYAANVLAGNKELADKLIAAAPELEGGYDKLADMVSDKNEELAKKLREVGRAHDTHAVQDIAPKFYNAQFHIQQDFKDQDPDRVAVVFKRDIMHAAANRISSRNASPFGL